jgi:hypothetical protein
MTFCNTDSRLILSHKIALWFVLTRVVTKVFLKNCRHKDMKVRPLLVFPHNFCGIAHRIFKKILDFYYFIPNTAIWFIFCTNLLRFSFVLNDTLSFVIICFYRHAVIPLCLTFFTYLIFFGISMKRNFLAKVTKYMFTKWYNTR